MGLESLIGSIRTVSSAQLVRGGVSGKGSWSIGAAAADASLTGAFAYVDSVVDELPATDQTKDFLKFLVRLADDYSNCLVEARGDPSVAAQRLLVRKGVHLTQYLGTVTQDELIELIGALAELLAAMPDRVRLMRLGGIAGIVAGVGLIANDLIAAGNGSAYLQRKYYETFLRKVHVSQLPIPRNPAKGPQLRPSP